MATAGPSAGGTFADDSGVGTVAWGTPGNALASDNVYATATLGSGVISHYLKVTNFGFAVPAGATINGITARIERKSAGGAHTDSRVRLVRAGVIETADKATGTAWPTSDGVATYGSAADLWSAAWAVADVNSSGFGLVVAAVGSSAINTLASVDFMSLQVDYTPAATGAKGLTTMGAGRTGRRRCERRMRDRWVRRPSGLVCQERPGRLVAAR